MNPSDPEVIPLEIITDPEAWITVFDGFDRPASAPRRGGGTLQLSETIRTGAADGGPWRPQLPPGKYLLKDAAAEKFFRLGGRARVQHESF